MLTLPQTCRRTAVTTFVAAVAAVAVAAPASAHVTVGADDARQGATDSILTFRVPNEEAAATTVKVTIAFPTKTPLPSVMPAPKQGWALASTKTKFNPPITTDDGTITDGITQVVYTAKTPADAIPVGSFETFQVLVGPLPPKATSLAFPTLQTYSDGKTVSWIQPIVDPANEPDSPAPTLQLIAADGDATTATSASPASAASPGPSVAASPAEQSGASRADVATARNLGIAGLVVGGLGLITGAVGVVRARRPRVAAEAQG
jgi:uncharacterized protein YcnI